MIDLDQIQVAWQLERAEGDRYRDFDGSTLPDAELAAVDVHEDDGINHPCAKPTFVTALSLKGKAATLSIVQVQVDYEKDEAISIKPIGTVPNIKEFPEGFFNDPGVMEAVHQEIKKLPEYEADRDKYEYAKLVRSWNK